MHNDKSFSNKVTKKMNKKMMRNSFLTQNSEKTHFLFKNDQKIKKKSKFFPEID